MPQDIVVGGRKVGERLFPIGTPFQPWDFMAISERSVYADADWTADGDGLHDGSDATYLHAWHTASGPLTALAGIEVERTTVPLESVSSVTIHTRQKNTNSSSSTHAEMSLTMHDWPLPETDDDSSTGTGREPWGLSQFDENGPWVTLFTADLLFVPANDDSIPDDGVTFNTVSQVVPWNGVGFGTPEADAEAAAYWALHLGKSDTYRANALAVGVLTGVLGDPNFDADSWLYEFWIDVLFVQEESTEVPRRRIFGRNDLSVFANRTPQRGFRAGSWTAL